MRNSWAELPSGENTIIMESSKDCSIQAGKLAGRAVASTPKSAVPQYLDKNREWVTATRVNYTRARLEAKTGGLRKQQEPELQHSSHGKRGSFQLFPALPHCPNPWTAAWGHLKNPRLISCWKLQISQVV